MNLDHELERLRERVAEADEDADESVEEHLYENDDNEYYTDGTHDDYGNYDS